MKTQAIVDDAEMIVETDDTISRIVNERVEGKSPSGKPWVRWRAVSRTFLSWKRGHLDIYQRGFASGMRDRSGGFIYNCTPYGTALDVESEFGRRVAARLGVDVSLPPMAEFGTPEWSRAEQRAFLDARRLAHDRLKRAVTIASYPLLADKPEWRPMPGMSRLLRAENLSEGVRAHFGVTRYRRDLVKAVGGTRSLHTVQYARAFAGLVPIDWVVDALRAESDLQKAVVRGGDEFALELRNPRPLLATLDERTLRRLLRPEGMPRAQWVIRDTLSQFQAVCEADPSFTPGRSFANWNELHDSMRLAQRRVGMVSKPIEQTKIAKKLDGATTSPTRLGPLELRSAKATGELLEWGELMSNCIGGYGDAAQKGRSNLFGVYAGETLVATMDVSDGKYISQLYGRFNQPLAAAEDAAVRELVQDRLGKVRSSAFDVLPPVQYDPARAPELVDHLVNF